MSTGPSAAPYITDAYHTAKFLLSKQEMRLSATAALDVIIQAKHNRDDLTASLGIQHLMVVHGLVLHSPSLRNFELARLTLQQASKYANELDVKHHGLSDHWIKMGRALANAGDAAKKEHKPFAEAANDYAVRLSDSDTDRNQLLDVAHWIEAGAKGKSPFSASFEKARKKQGWRDRGISLGRGFIGGVGGYIGLVAGLVVGAIFSAPLAQGVTTLLGLTPFASVAGTAGLVTGVCGLAVITFATVPMVVDKFKSIQKRIIKPDPVRQGRWLKYAGNVAGFATAAAVTITPMELYSQMQAEEVGQPRFHRPSQQMQRLSPVQPHAAALVPQASMRQQSKLVNT